MSSRDTRPSLGLLLGLFLSIAFRHELPAQYDSWTSFQLGTVCVSIHADSTISI
jgi:hypothetical protein